MKAKIFIDDIRNPPDETWKVARTPDEAIYEINKNKGNINIISFDHDLGEDNNGKSLTTREVVLWMIKEEINADKYIVHSSNPVGREWLEGMINRYLK